MGARFLLGIAPCSPDGPGGNGEVYDYLVRISPPLYSFGNRVWMDVDNNGQMNGVEVGASGVAVSCTKPTPWVDRPALCC